MPSDASVWPTPLALACANAVRLRLLQNGAVVTMHARRVRLTMSSACPYQAEFTAACHALDVAAR
ncbi:MAG: transposase [Gammaproteobacteria bacterium]|nr:transposase [Gammaproteobacteria bacterium]